MSQHRIVVMTGSAAWTEPGHGQGVGPGDCPICRGRDLESERERGLSRLCLRCLTWTWDTPPSTDPSTPDETLACSTSSSR